MTKVRRGAKVALLPLGGMAKKGEGGGGGWWSLGWSVQRGDQRNARDEVVGGRTEGREDGKVDELRAVGGEEVEGDGNFQGEEGDERAKEACP